VKSGICRAMKISQKGFQLRFYPSNVSEQLWVNPTWRDQELCFFRSYLKPADRVIDVGANIGDTALTAALCVGSRGRVWAIEPHPRTYGFLIGNIALNDASNIEATNAAAGSEAGDVPFGNGRRDDMNRVGVKGILVSARRLDDLVPYRGEIRLLKIDVEGYELAVLKGASKILSNTHCVYFEVSEDQYRNFGYTIKEVLDLLRGSGFSLFRPECRNVMRQIDCWYSPKGTENLIAVRDTTDLARRTGWAIA
jgi:FkbM family methyltransferase